jgi:hypothetical protein
MDPITVYHDPVMDVVPEVDARQGRDARADRALIALKPFTLENSFVIMLKVLFPAYPGVIRRRNAWL